MIAPDCTFDDGSPWQGWLDLVPGRNLAPESLEPLLISFCNVTTPGFTLLLLDPVTLRGRWLARETDALRRLNGSSGLCRDGVDLLVMHQIHGRASPMSRLGPDLVLLGHEVMNPVFDGHDLAVLDGGLAVADTGHDRVAFRSSNGAWRTLHAEQPGFGDQSHLNSVVAWREDLYATTFGPKTNGSWRDSAGGRIVRVADGSTAVSGVSQPHSLIGTGERLMWCESARSEIRSSAGDGSVKIEARLRGYLRGLAVTDRHFIAAASAWRAVSRHEGTASEAPKAPHGLLNQAALYVIDRATGAVAVSCLSPFGMEIFAIETAAGADIEPQFMHATAERAAAIAAAAEPSDQTLA